MTSPSASEHASCQLVVVWGEELRVFELPSAGNATIGRAAGNAICLDHESVSRWHALLRVGSSFVIEDLGAANGSFVLRSASISD